MSTTCRLAEHGEFFATRAKARAIREGLEKLPASEAVIFDFGGVAGMTVSFGDELVGKFTANHPHWAVTGASADVLETVETVLRRRRASRPDGEPRPGGEGGEEDAGGDVGQARKHEGT